MNNNLIERIGLNTFLWKFDLLARIREILPGTRCTQVLGCFARNAGDYLYTDDEKNSKTKAMERALRRNASPTALIGKVQQDPLRSYLISLMGRRNISTDALAELAALNRASLYKILNGSTRHPQRNVLIRLALVLRLNFEETQQFLHYGGCAQLSGNRARDIIISNGIIKGNTIDDVNYHLQAHYFVDLYGKE